MLDTDQVLWALYNRALGEPEAFGERKPENAREDFWHVTRAIARRASLPAFKVIEQDNGLYAAYIADADTGYEPRFVGQDMTIKEWYEKVEEPLRNRN